MTTFYRAAATDEGVELFRGGGESHDARGSDDENQRGGGDR